MPTPQNPNRTRDHLANERTFLAWVRTALGLLGMGFVLARMGLFLRQISLELPGGSSRPVRSAHEYLAVGVVFLLLGTGLTGFAAWLHERNRRAIEAEVYVPSRLAVFGLAAVVILGGLVIAGMVIWRTSLGTE